MQNEMKKIEG